MILLLACNGPDWQGDDPVSAVDDTGALDTSDTGSPTEDDYDIFEQMRDGELDAEAGFYAVAASGGWPIEHDGACVFAALDEGSEVSLAGDHNDWTPEPMTLGDIWWAEVEIAAPEGSLYKFVVEGDYVADDWSRAYGYDDFGAYSLVEGGGGNLEWWLIDGRVVRVWVPLGAVTHQLYVADGQNLFDPDAAYGGWRLQEVLGSGTMAIGIDNSGAGRLDEYGPVEDDIGDGDVYGGGGDAYADWVLEIVRPKMEAEYGAAGTRGLMGSSMGGLISLYMGFRDPAEWDYAASLSGTLGWGSIGYDDPVIFEAATEKKDIAVFLDSGGTEGSGCVDSDGDGVEDDGNGSDNYCVNRQLADLLADTGWSWETDLWHWHEAGATHNEAAWADRVWRPVSYFEGL
ncbi:MAG TPA: alpha/beta hydrolase-fold protein [Myxococcota bacterium]|nr:alpha/beta hydrolase-fold protein [Myxococcota bacterium]